MTRRTAAGVLSGLLLLAGCSGSAPDDRDSAPSDFGVAWHECPDEVAIALSSEHRCGTLTVPVDHSDRGGPTLGLQVVQVWPSGDAVRRDDEEVALSVGFNFGEPRQPPGDMHVLAERIAVPVVSVAPRGVGEEGGTPLDCPELDGLGPAGLDRPDSESRDAFVAAVTRCRDRLTREGIDLDLFGTDDIAEDVESLRSAMGVDEWYALVSYGELSRVTEEYAASHGARVRAVVEDSPAPSGRDSIAAGAAGLRSGLAALFSECAQDPPCARRYPDLDVRWQQALDRLTAEPLSGSSAQGPVRIDAPRFLRAVRSMLGDGPRHVPDLPRIITTAAQGQLHPTLASVVAGDPDHCLGHRPICTRPGFSAGAYLSQACPQLGTTGTVEEDALYREVFVAGPYADACAAWDVEASVPPPAPAVPTLVLTGDLDSWSRPEWFESEVNVRGASHDVAGSAQCVFEVRNPWIADPTQPPDPRPCETEPFPAWD